MKKSPKLQFPNISKKVWWYVSFPTSSRSLCLPPARIHFWEFTARLSLAKSLPGSTVPKNIGLNYKGDYWHFIITVCCIVGNFCRCKFLQKFHNFLGGFKFSPVLPSWLAFDHYYETPPSFHHRRKICTMGEFLTIIQYYKCTCKLVSLVTNYLATIINGNEI